MRPSSTLHHWLRARRDELGLRQEQIERATAEGGEEARVTQSYLSKLERGQKPLSALTPSKMDALRRALGVSAGEWIARTGLSVITPGSLAQGSEPGELIAGLEFIRLPVRALATAGLPLTENDESVIDHDLVPASEYRAGMVVLEVQGDSMTDRSGGLQSGDRIYVDTADLELREGRVYVLHVPGSGLVVKRVRNFGGNYWLTSDNPDYPPLKPEQATVVGRVYYHQPRGRRV
jgi:repressor LexA